MGMADYTPDWLEPEDVASWLRLNTATSDVDATELAVVCAGTEEYVQRCRPDQYVPDPDMDPESPGPGTYTPSADVYRGAVLYASRQYRRRNSPAGIETWAEGGAVFVAKYDADIERSLRTGQWNVPGFG